MTRIYSDLIMYALSFPKKARPSNRTHMVALILRYHYLLFIFHKVKMSFHADCCTTIYNLKFFSFT